MELKFPFSLTTFFLLLFFLINLVKVLNRFKTQNTTSRQVRSQSICFGQVPSISRSDGGPTRRETEREARMEGSDHPTGRKPPEVISSPSRLPPGPWKLPVIGSIHHLVGSLPHHSLANLARKYGPLMHLQIGENSTIVVSSPRLAKEVMQTHDLALADRPKIEAAKLMTYNYADIAYCPYGDYWRQMRKVCTLELLSAKNVRSFRSIREDEVFQLIESVKSSSGLPINLTEKLFSLTNDVTLRAVFGKRYEDKDALIPLIREAIDVVAGFNMCDLFPSLKVVHFLSGVKSKLARLHQKMDQILDKIINEHEENVRSNQERNGEGGEEHLLDVLLRLKHEGGLQFPMTNNNIKAVIEEIFCAGTETSSTTVNWAIAEMVRNQRVMEKTQAELRQVLGEKKTICEADIQGLKYLNLVIKETLRLHPPAPLLLPRECREQIEIDGYLIPVKTKVIVNAWAIGRDPAYWVDAESFSPERFDDNPVDFIGTDFQYIPFGAGRRMCPGIAFGLANVELPLAQLLYHFNWKLSSGTKPEDLDMTETFGASVRRRSDLHMIASPYFST